jgi:hypothetical protein
MRNQRCEMTTVYLDAPFSDDERRHRLFNGDLLVYSPRASTLAFCEFARGLIQEAFGDLNPPTAQHSLPVAEYAEILGKLKPYFIHHPRSKELIRDIFADMGCDIKKTYFEVPKLRSSTSDGYITAGIAYAWHPHRDTWYSAPSCQINWWIPIYEIESDNAMAFHPLYWNKAVANTSSGYNYYEWNKQHRTNITQHLKKDPRPLPRPVDQISREPEIRLICPVGGMILFAAAQMHSSVPNTSGLTRFSLDFRSAHMDDLLAGNGAPNPDSACTGTVLREFLQAGDFTRLPEEVVSRYEDGTELAEHLVFRPI